MIIVIVAEKEEREDKREESREREKEERRKRESRRDERKRGRKRGFPCVGSKRLRVYVHNASVCTGKTRACW